MRRPSFSFLFDARVPVDLAKSRLNLARRIDDQLTWLELRLAALRPNPKAFAKEKTAGA